MIIPVFNPLLCALQTFGMSEIGESTGITRVLG